jgi:hypothetical protein
MNEDIVIAVGAVTVRACENSELSPVESFLAIAVITLPRGTGLPRLTLKDPTPIPLEFVVVDPRYVCPSP